MTTFVWITLAVATVSAVGLLASTRARHAAGAFALLARDPRVPRPVRALLLFALLPIPGPFEEIVGGLALAYVARRFPAVWAEHSAPRDSASSGIPSS